MGVGAHDGPGCHWTERYSLRNHRRLVSTRSGRLESVDPAAGGGNGADRRSTVVCCTEPKDRPELICPSGEMRRRHPQGQRTDPKVQSRQRLRARPLTEGNQSKLQMTDRPGADSCLGWLVAMTRLASVGRVARATRASCCRRGDVKPSRTGGDARYQCSHAASICSSMLHCSSCTVTRM